MAGFRLMRRTCADWTATWGKHMKSVQFKEIKVIIVQPLFPFLSCLICSSCLDLSKFIAFSSWHFAFVSEVVSNILCSFLYLFRFFVWTVSNRICTTKLFACFLLRNGDPFHSVLVPGTCFRPVSWIHDSNLKRNLSPSAVHFRLCRRGRR